MTHISFSLKISVMCSLSHSKSLRAEKANSSTSDSAIWSAEVRSSLIHAAEPTGRREPRIAAMAERTRGDGDAGFQKTEQAMQARWFVGGGKQNTTQLYAGREGGGRMRLQEVEVVCRSLSVALSVCGWAGQDRFVLIDSKSG